MRRCAAASLRARHLGRTRQHMLLGSKRDAGRLAVSKCWKGGALIKIKIKVHKKIILYKHKKTPKGGLPIVPASTQLEGHAGGQAVPTSGGRVPCEERVWMRIHIRRFFGLGWHLAVNWSLQLQALQCKPCSASLAVQTLQCKVWQLLWIF